MPVMVAGRFCYHITEVEKRNARKIDHPVGIWLPGDRIPAHLVLRGDRLWYDEEPLTIDVRGRWPGGDPRTQLDLLRPD